MTAAPSPFEERVANLVAEAVSEIVAVCMRDRPDADLTHKGGHHIGLEVVRTADQQAAFAEKRMIEARNHFEEALRAARITGSFLVSFDLLDVGEGNSREHRQWMHGTAKLLVERLRTASEERLEKAELEARGITRIAYVDTKPKEVLSVGRGYVQRHQPGQSIAEQVLRKKDERLRGYRQLNGDHFKEYWLVIASIGPGTVEDGGYTLLLDRNFPTSYDRVFLIYRGSPPRAVEITPRDSENVVDLTRDAGPNIDV